MNALSECNQESLQAVTGQGQENALLTERIEALEYQCKRDEKRIIELEANIRELSEQLVEKEGRARTVEGARKSTSKIIKRD